MSDTSINQEELDDLCEQLKNLQLSDSQRALLDAILKIAWDFAGSHESLEAEFDGCFEPGEAELIMSYKSSAWHSSIVRSAGPGSIVRTINP